MEDAQGVFGKVRGLFANAFKSADLGSRGVVSILCGTLFKITIVLACLGLILSVILAIVLLSPFLYAAMQKKRKEEREDANRSMDRKQKKEDEKDWSGKSIDEILNL